MGIMGFVIFVLLIVIAARNSDFHIGFSAVFAALVFGVFAVGLTADEVLALFPTRLLLTLVAVTLLFSIADTNGTLAIIADHAVRLCRGRTQVIPLVVFILTFTLSALGVGNIAATALMVPTAMVLARKIRLKVFLMSLVVVGGANAASLSPFSLTGILLTELMQKALPELGYDAIQYAVVKIFFLTFVSISVVHMIGFLVCGGLKWLKECSGDKVSSDGAAESRIMSWSQRFTCAAILAFACGIFMGNSSILVEVLGSRWHELGSQLTAVSLGLVVLLMLGHVVKTEQAIAKIPWSTIMLVTGIVTYLGVLEHAGAIAWASGVIQSQPFSGGIIPSLALGSATLSSISSSSGVVLPLFVPMVPSLESHSTNALSLIATICVSAHLVDCSPFSTLGALCLASAKDGQAEGQENLFRSLLIWGLIMIPVAVILMWILWFCFG